MLGNTKSIAAFYLDQPKEITDFPWELQELHLLVHILVFSPRFVLQSWFSSSWLQLIAI